MNNKCQSYKSINLVKLFKSRRLVKNEDISIDSYQLSCIDKTNFINQTESRPGFSDVTNPFEIKMLHKPINQFNEIVNVIIANAPNLTVVVTIQQSNIIQSSYVWIRKRREKEE